MPATKAPAAVAPIGFGSAGKQATQIASQLGVLQTRAATAQGAVRNLGNALAFSAYSGKTLAKSAASTSAAVSTSAQKAIAARSAVAGYAGSAAKAGAAVAAMGVLSTEAGQGLGVTNTALLGMTGAMAGPWGAAIGAGVGLVLDFASASGDANEAIRQMNSAVADAGTDFGALNDLTANGNESTAAFIDGMSGVGKAFQALDEAFTGENAIDTFRESADEAEDKARDMISAFQDVAVAAGFETTDEIGRSVLPSMRELQAVAESAAPALEALNIDPGDPAAISANADAIVEWMRHADSAAGRTEAFAKSVAELGNDALSTADSAAVMSAALDSLIAPTLGAEGATDAWRTSLAGLDEALKPGAGFSGFSEAAIANREATRSYTETSMARLKALAAVSTTTQGDMARAVSQTRSEFIKSATAAGIDRKAVIARANAMGLTPKLVRTVFQAAGITKSEQQARQLRATFRSLPQRLRTEIRTDGVPKTRGDVKELAGRYKNLSRQQVRTLIRLQDEGARRGITNIDRLLRSLGRQKPNPKVDVDTGAARNAVGTVDRELEKTGRKRVEAKIDADNGPAQRAIAQTNQGLTEVGSRNVSATVGASVGGALSAIGSVRSELNGISGTSVNTYINVITRRSGKAEDGAVYAGGVRAFADGGWGQERPGEQRRRRLLPTLPAGGVHPRRVRGHLHRAQAEAGPQQGHPRPRPPRRGHDRRRPGRRAPRRHPRVPHRRAGHRRRPPRPPRRTDRRPRPPAQEVRTP